jgi:hypothetical protein
MGAVLIVLLKPQIRLQKALQQGVSFVDRVAIQPGTGDRRLPFHGLFQRNRKTARIDRQQCDSRCKKQHLLRKPDEFVPLNQKYAFPQLMCREIRHAIDRSTVPNPQIRARIPHVLPHHKLEIPSAERLPAAVHQLRITAY